MSLKVYAKIWLKTFQAYCNMVELHADCCVHQFRNDASLGLWWHSVIDVVLVIFICFKLVLSNSRQFGAEDIKKIKGSVLEESCHDRHVVT